MTEDTTHHFYNFLPAIDAIVWVDEAYHKPAIRGVKVKVLRHSTGGAMVEIKPIESTGPTECIGWWWLRKKETGC